MAGTGKIDGDLLALPTGERARLAELLLESLHGEEDPSADEAWRNEVSRRLDDVDAGRVTPDAARDAVARVRARLRRK